MIQPLKQNLSPRMKIQVIERHRLFNQEMLSHNIDTLTEERALATTPYSATTWGQKIEREVPLYIGNGIIMTQDLEGSLERSPPHTLDSGIAEVQPRPGTSDRVGDKRKLPPSEGGTVVLRKKRRIRGKGRG